MTKPIQIKNEDVVRDIRELAALRGQAITDTVGEITRAELERARRRASSEDNDREIDRILAEIRALPRVGVVPHDDDFYDEDGLPK
jgi:hypothetical protein